MCLITTWLVSCKTGTIHTLGKYLESDSLFFDSYHTCYWTLLQLSVVCLQQHQFWIWEAWIWEVKTQLLYWKKFYFIELNSLFSHRSLYFYASNRYASISHLSHGFSHRSLYFSASNRYAPISHFFSISASNGQMGTLSGPFAMLVITKFLCFKWVYDVVFSMFLDFYICHV